MRELELYALNLRFKKIWPYLFLILAAALQALSLPPFNLSWLVFAFAIPLFAFFAEEERLGILLLGFFIYRILAMIGIVYFVLDPILFVLSSAIFLILPLGFWLIRKANRNLAFALMPILWTFCDYLSARYTVLPNFVMMAGNALGNSPFLGLASFWGITSLTFFALSMNLLIFGAMKNWRGKRRLANVFMMGTVVILGAAWLVSSSALGKNREAYAARPKGAGIMLVSQKEGLDKIFKDRALGRSDLERLVHGYLATVKKSLAEKNFDILVLPDSMFDVDYDPVADAEAFSKFGISNNASLIAGYRNLARDLQKSLVASMIALQNGRRYNALLFFGPNGELTDVFYKKYLAITGEYWPFPNWHPFYLDEALKENPDEYRDYAVFNPGKIFSSGETKTVRVNGIVFAPAICVEIHYPAEVAKRVDLGADAILDTSSNLWADDFGLKHYLELTNNLRRIESVWLKTPIFVNGRKEPPLVVLPDGNIEGTDSRIENGDYEMLVSELKF